MVQANFRLDFLVPVLYGLAIDRTICIHFVSTALLCNPTCNPLTCFVRNTLARTIALTLGQKTRTQKNSKSKNIEHRRTSTSPNFDGTVLGSGKSGVRFFYLCPPHDLSLRSGQPALHPVVSDRRTSPANPSPSSTAPSR